jgi:hypothetical protein
MLERTSLYAESWNVAFRKKTSNILNDKETPFNIIKNSWRYWAADPFIFEIDDTTYIFAELYDYIYCKGTLGYCKLENGKKPKWKKVISEKFHLSYPYIANDAKNIYIIPESGNAKILYSYKATSFPKKWARAHLIRKGVNFGDTTPFSLNQNKLALAYDVSNPDKYQLLLIDLENPKNDTLILGNHLLQRPAGKFFYKGDTLIRPAQICEKDYGQGLVFYKVSSFEPGNYTEEELTRIFPTELNYSKKMILDGMHTYNSNENYEVIDIKTRRFNIINLIFRIFNKLK